MCLLFPSELATHRYALLVAKLRLCTQPSTRVPSCVQAMIGASLPTEEQLEKLRLFVDLYNDELRDVEKALDASFSEVWDAQTDPIEAVLHIKESCSVRELLRTDNRVVHKTMTVFTSLCNEVEQLKEKAERDFYDALGVFGEPVADSEQAEEGDEQQQIAALLPILQDL